jgi:hypothetical protein
MPTKSYDLLVSPDGCIFGVGCTFWTSTGKVKIIDFIPPAGWPWENPNDYKNKSIWYTVFVVSVPMSLNDAEKHYKHFGKYYPN